VTQHEGRRVRKEIKNKKEFQMQMYERERIYNVKWKDIKKIKNKIGFLM
jgi:hypothetical protein